MRWICRECRYDLRGQVALAQAQEKDAIRCPECGTHFELKEFADTLLLVDDCPRGWLPLMMLGETVAMALPVGHARAWNPPAETGSRRMRVVLAAILLEQLLALLFFAMVPIVAHVTLVDDCPFCDRDDPLTIPAWQKAMRYAGNDRLWLCMAFVCTAYAPGTLVLARLPFKAEFGRGEWRDARWVHTVRRCFAVAAPGIMLAAAVAVAALLYIRADTTPGLFDNKLTLFPWALAAVALIALGSLARTGWIDSAAAGAVRYVAYGLVAIAASAAWLALGGLLVAGHPLGLRRLFELVEYP